LISSASFELFPRAHAGRSAFFWYSIIIIIIIII